VFGWVNEWNGQLNPRIAGHDGRTGDRPWITPVIGALGESHNARPEDSPRIDVQGLTPDRLYVAHLTYLSALDRAAGEVLHTISQRR